jgi:hypothetical protein
VDYLSARENYKVALHRWGNFQQRLIELTGARDAGDMEVKLVEQHARLAGPIAEFGRLDQALDLASRKWEAAQLLLAKRTAAATAQVTATYNCSIAENEKPKKSRNPRPAWPAPASRLAAASRRPCCCC